MRRCGRKLAAALTSDIHGAVTKPKAMDHADMTWCAHSCRRRRDGGARGVRHCGDPRRARLSAVLFNAAHQQSHRRVRRQPETRALSARVSGRAGGVAPAQPISVAYPPTTGWETKASRPGCRGDRAPAERPASISATSRRADLHAARPVYDACSRRRSRTASATRRHGDDGRRNIYEPDHVNSILMAGRADLCLARPHLRKTRTDPSRGSSAWRPRGEMARPYLTAANSCGGLPSARCQHGKV